MARIVRIYIYVRDLPVDFGTLERFAKAAELAAQSLGRESFDVPVEVNLTLSEGSLKVVAATVASVLFSTYYFVGNYKSFKEGVVAICDDANNFGDHFCDTFLHSVGIEKGQVSKQTVTVQTPAELRDILVELEQLNNAAGDAKRLTIPSAEAERMRLRLARAATRLDHILRDLNEQDRTAVIQSLKFEALPPYDHWPRQKHLPPEPERVAQGAKFAIKQRIEEGGLMRAGKPKLRVKTRVQVHPKPRRDAARRH